MHWPVLWTHIAECVLKYYSHIATKSAPPHGQAVGWMAHLLLCGLRHSVGGAHGLTVRHDGLGHSLRVHNADGSALADLGGAHGVVGGGEGLLLDPHDGGDVGLEPDAIPDELRQLLVHQRLVLLEALPGSCEGATCDPSDPSSS